MALCVEFVEQLSAFFDQSVASLNDDELFAAGYLRGHIDLAVGTFEVAATAYARPELIEAVDASLQTAIDRGELTEQDQSLVRALWSRLQQ